MIWNDGPPVVANHVFVPSASLNDIEMPQRLANPLPVTWTWAPPGPDVGETVITADGMAVLADAADIAPPKLRMTTARTAARHPFALHLLDMAAPFESKTAFRPLTEACEPSATRSSLILLIWLILEDEIAPVTPAPAARARSRRPSPPPGFDPSGRAS